VGTKRQLRWQSAELSAQVEEVAIQACSRAWVAESRASAGLTIILRMTS